MGYYMTGVWRVIGLVVTSCGDNGGSCDVRCAHAGRNS